MTLRSGFRLALALPAAFLAFGGSAAGREVEAPIAIATGPAILSGRAGPDSRTTSVFLRPDALETLRSAGTDENLEVRRFPIDAATSVDLELHRFDLFAPGARNVEAGADGVEREAPAPDAAFFEGTVAGDSESRVFLSAFAGSIHGYIQRGDDTFAVEPRGRWGEETPAHVVRRLTKDEWAALAAAFRCDAERLAPPSSTTRMALASASIVDTGQAYAATIAVDTDYELFRIFGNAATERNYVSNELAAVSAIYWRDLKTRLTVGFLRVWTSSSDPWSGTTPIAALFEVGDYWHAHGSGTARAAVVFLSGKNLGGGVSWVGTLAGPDLWDSTDSHWAGAYAVVGNIEGALSNFHAPLAGSDVWDIESVAHELGHTFGSVHTHCYVPPIDECYGSEPGCYSGPNIDPGPGVGTIMSYCHLFGWSEISLKFHPRCIDEQLRPTILLAASKAPSLLVGGVFTDVPASDPYASSVSTIAAWGIIPGCTATAFCPNQSVSRADMAVFIERGLNVFVPPPNRPQIFSDVAPGAYAYDFIEDFSKRRITDGCSATTYCPTSAVTRAQMAVFLLRAEHGSTYTPPAASGKVFADVPAGAFAAAWIEQLARESITLGCGNGDYCPDASVPRNQMATFLVRTLHL